MDSSDLVVLPSDTYRRRFVEAFPRLRSRAIFIHNGVNLEHFKPAGDVGGPAGERYLLCVADLQEYKAIDVLLRAVQPLFASDPTLTLVLAGDGPLRGELEALAASLGIAARTTFLGIQQPAEIVRLLHGCQAMVLPSRMESFGIVLLEAMASRTPVVASAVGGIPEIVEHGVTGLLVAPDDPPALTAALQRVLTEHDLRRRIAENGFSRVRERFGSTHNGTAYVRAFATVLNGEPATPLSPSELPAPR